MGKLLRLYNQNRRAFWLGIITIGFIALIIWRLVFLVFSNELQKDEYKDDIQISNDEYNSIYLESTKSAITGRTTTIDQESVSTIDQFFSYCNSKNIQEAYNLVSDECKEVMFTDINLFNTAYCAPLFNNGKRSIKIENWYGNIFRVEINEDSLSTGRVSNNNTNVDYITTVKGTDGNIKLNINSYIGRTNLNKSVSSNGIDITIVKKDEYMDYETYTFEVKNNTENSIILGNIQDDENVSYLIDKNNLKFNAYVYELAQPQLEVFGNQNKQVTIKYFNEHGSTKVIKSLVFPRIYLNYEEYKKYPKSYTGFASAVIDM